MKVTLDTNAYSALLRGRSEVAERIRRAQHIFLSTIVVGELLFGFRNGSHYERNQRELDDFLANPYVSLLPVTLTTADRFGRLAAALRQAGTPIPTNDIWIAAHAMETGADLLSYDQHFRFVAGLVWTHLVRMD